MKNLAIILIAAALGTSAMGQKSVPTGTKTDTRYTEGASGVRRSISYTFSSLRADGDPGNGVFRYNKDALEDVAWIYLDNNDLTGENQSKWYATWDDTTGAMGRGQLNIVGKDGGTVNIFRITGLFIRGNGYWKIPVQYVSGKMPADGAICFYIFNRIENKKPESKVPGIVIKEPVAEIKEPVVEIKVPVTEVKEPVIEIKEPVVEIKEPVIEIKEPVVEIKEPVAEVKEPVIEIKEPVAEIKEPVVEIKVPDIEVKEPVAEITEPVVEIKEPVTEVKEPVIEIKEPVVEIKEPVAEVKEPVVEIKEPVTVIKEPVVEIKQPVVEVKEPVQENIEQAVSEKNTVLTEKKRQPSQKQQTIIQKTDKKVMMNSEVKQVANTRDPQVQTEDQRVVNSDQTTLKTQTIPAGNQSVQQGQVTNTTRINQTSPVYRQTSSQDYQQNQANQTNVGITAGNYVKRENQQNYQERQDVAGSSVTGMNTDFSRNAVTPVTSKGSLGEQGYQVTVTNTGSETVKRRKCYRGIIEAGYGLGIGEYGMNNFRFNFINGFKTGQYSSLGVGIGFRSFSLKSGREWFLPSGSSHVPLFIDFRTTFSDRDVTPYFAIDGGISVRAVEVVSDGLFLGASGGIWFNISRKFAVFAGMAWEMQKMEFANLSDNLCFNRYANSLSLNIGISF